MRPAIGPDGAAVLATLLAAVLTAWLWFGNPALAPPLAAPAARTAVVAASATSVGYGRITYPPGQYPQIRLGTGETRSIHSLLDVTHQLQFGEYRWNTRGVPPGPVWLRIDLETQLISVFRGDNEIGTAVILYGTKADPTPVGVFAVLAKHPYYHSQAYDAPMPYALRITADGVALHASDVRDHRATHGCIGMPLEFARLLYAVINLGDRVAISGASAHPIRH